MVTGIMIGIDEVGRGCLAGPLLVVAARQKTIVSKDSSWQWPTGLADSKTLTRLRREKLFQALVNICEFGEGWVSALEIDRRGLAWAMQLGVARSLRNLGALHHDRIIIDGPVNYLPKVFNNVKCLINADALVPLVSAASVYAKVRRDRYMIKLAKRYYRYGFASNVGYYTPQHKVALERFGPLTAIHRLSFQPLRTQL